jgi:hypothetical protein
MVSRQRILCLGVFALWRSCRENVLSGARLRLVIAPAAVFCPDKPVQNTFPQ